MNVSEGDQEPTPFYVPRKFLAANSTHFARLFGASDFDNTFSLTADPAAFSVWLQTLYQREVILEDGDDSPALSEAEMWKLLAEVYVLALRLGDIASTNRVMEAILARLKNPFGHEQPAVIAAIEVAFAGSEEGNATPTKLRMILVDYGVYRLFSETLSKISECKGASQYFLDMAQTFVTIRERKTSFDGFSMASEFGKDGSKPYLLGQTP